MIQLSRPAGLPPLSPFLPSPTAPLPFPPTNLLLLKAIGSLLLAPPAAVATGNGDSVLSFPELEQLEARRPSAYCRLKVWREREGEVGEGSKEGDFSQENVQPIPDILTIS